MLSCNFFCSIKNFDFALIVYQFLNAKIVIEVNSGVKAFASESIDPSFTSPDYHIQDFSNFLHSSPARHSARKEKYEKIAFKYAC